MSETTTTPTSLTRADLLRAARSFCDCFAQKKPLEEVLSHFARPETKTQSKNKNKNKDKPKNGSGDNGNANEYGKEEADKNGDKDEANKILVHEHGLPHLAPFLGRDFVGLEGAREYFGLLARYLTYEDMRFVEFVVDTGEAKVAVRGQARFTWTQDTKQSWDETFVYVLRFDAHAPAGPKLTRYEVWADSGAAYLARRGELDT